VLLLVAGEDKPTKFIIKGDIWEVISAFTEGGVPRGFGSQDPRNNPAALGRWCIGEISDKSKNQVNAYLQRWKIQFEHTLINQNAKGWRFDIEVDPVYISASEKNKNQIKQEMIDYLEENFTRWNSYWYSCSINAWTSSGITIDITKPIQGNSRYGGTDPEWILLFESNWTQFLVELKNDFHDKFSTTLELRRYRFKPASVDTVTVGGGYIEMAAAEALNHIEDKIAVD
jgi:hypothetical protein